MADELTVPFARDALARGAVLAVRCKGRSMVPTVRAGDRVDVAAATPEIGDVVLVADGDLLVLHRLVARLPGAWVAHRGDARLRSAGLSRASSVLGVARLRRARAPVLLRWAAASWAVLRAVLAAR